jgi:hypothetical protein
MNVSNILPNLADDLPCLLTSSLVISYQGLTRSWGHRYGLFFFKRIELSGTQELEGLEWGLKDRIEYVAP